MFGFKPIGDGLEPEQRGHSQGPPKDSTLRSQLLVLLYRCSEALWRLGMGRIAGERLKSRVMPGRMDLTSPVWIQCSEGAYSSLKLENLPMPVGYGTVVNGRTYIQLPPKRQGVDSQRYRVIWPYRSDGPNSKLATSSFTLSPGHTNQTLFFLAEFLRSQGVTYVSLANKHGTAFSSAALKGSSLAYLCRDELHTVAPVVDLVDEPFPEDIVVFGN